MFHLRRFQCSSASRKFLKKEVSDGRFNQDRFQCSSASRKFLKVVVTHNEHPALAVSVLFSEPKIPQITTAAPCNAPGSGFSALQRAENSSNKCSLYAIGMPASFSALQRAENSSKGAGGVSLLFEGEFQCSSASRKFLKRSRQTARTGSRLPFQCSSASRKFLKIALVSKARALGISFSALQRAENSSNEMLMCSFIRRPCFSALQRAENSSNEVSPLVSSKQRSFSALQRAENSSNHTRVGLSSRKIAFQCSSASRKFLKRSSGSRSRRS